MFAKTFSFWRRLVQPTPVPSSDSDTAVNDDRRLWIRYSADVQASAQVLRSTGNRRVDVRVRDISMGGASLQTTVRFQTGQMITLELPVRDEERTVLACIVRCQPDGTHWNVGCVFSRELSSEDLEILGARRIENDVPDQRRWQRFESRLHAQYQVVGDAESRPITARVLNISASGIGLQVCEPLEAGCLINLDLYDSDGQPVRSILACIVHTTTRANGERAIGCNFIRELAEEDLQSLI